MDATKRDLIDKILHLAETEPIISMIVDEYAIKYKKSRHDATQSHVNDIIMDIVDKLLLHKKENENIIKMLISKEQYVLNVY